MLVDSFIFSNFNYSPFVWHLEIEIETVQERALRLLYDSYSRYNSLLLKAERPTMKASRLRRLSIEVFRTFNSLNPEFMRTYFKKGSHFATRKKYLVIQLSK